MNVIQEIATCDSHDPSSESSEDLSSNLRQRIPDALKSTCLADAGYKTIVETGNVEKPFLIEVMRSLTQYSITHLLFLTDG